MVELSSGTHRVAEDPRKHSLADGEGGHYSTNLDRNRYGSDNNYLFTVTRFDLEALGMCPCMVDIEIIDTRNGNEAQLVCAGTDACTCNDPTRKQLADLSYYPQETRAPSPPPAREMRRVASAGNLMKRSGSAAQLAAAAGGMGMGGMIGGMRRPPSSNRLHMNAYAAEQSRGSGGSELFDALLMAATDNLDKEQTKSQGEPPVSSRSGQRRQQQQQQQQQQQMRINEVDSLQANMDALANSNAAAARQQSRPMLRRNSVSMIIENPVLAQTGAAESLLMNYWQHPFMPHMIMAGGDPDAMMMMGAAGLAGGGIGSLGGVPGVAAGAVGGGEEGQGDTDKADGTEVQDGGGHAPDVNSVEGNFRQGLLKHFHKQSSAANLTRLAGGGGMLEADMSELKTRAEAAESKLKATEAAARKAAETIQVLQSKLNEAGVTDVPDVDTTELQTAEERITQLQDELAREQTERKNAEAKLKACTAVVTTGAAGTTSLPGMHQLPPLPYAAAAAMLPMFGLNPYGNMAGGASKPPIPHHHHNGVGAAAAAAAVNGVVSMMQKVASMPAMHHHGGMSPASKPSPPGFRAAPPPPPAAAAAAAAAAASEGDVEDDKRGIGKRALYIDNDNMEGVEGVIKKVKHEDGEAAREEGNVNGVEKEGDDVAAAAAAAAS